MMSQMLSTSAEELSARSAMYRLLARLWVREVDAELMQQFQSPQLRDAFAAAGGKLPSDAGEAAIEDLAIDYCQLFIGPSDHLPPYQSVWHSGQFHGSPVESMRRYIDVAGYASDERQSGLMLDHLGVQLDVMSHLLKDLAGRRRNSKEHQAVQDLADAFFQSHLQWPSNLLDAAFERATSGFYRSVIFLTREYLKSEAPV